MHDAAACLETHPVFRSDDREEVRTFLREKEFEFDIARRGRAAGPIDCRFNAVYLPSLEISFVQFGAAAETRAAPQRSDYRIQFPLAGAAETVFGRERLICAAGSGVVTSPTAPQRISADAECRRVLVMFERDALARHLAALTGRPLARELAFEPALDLTRGAGLTLMQLLRFALAELDRPGGALRNPMALNQFEQLFMTMLLLAHPHNYSAALAGPDVDVAPRDVKRAVDYMHANLARPITLADLVAVSGVPGRTLRQHFRDFRGLSPMAYLRQARYAMAHGDLQRPDGRSVTEIAHRWGFDHLGRFDAGYRRLYGESPSRTLQRCRGGPESLRHGSDATGLAAHDEFRWDLPGRSPNPE